MVAVGDRAAAAGALGVGPPHVAARRGVGLRPRVDLRPPGVALARRRAVVRHRAAAGRGGGGHRAHRARHVGGVAELPAPRAVRQGRHGARRRQRRAVPARPRRRAARGSTPRCSATAPTRGERTRRFEEFVGAARRAAHPAGDRARGRVLRGARRADDPRHDRPAAARRSWSRPTARGRWRSPRGTGRGGRPTGRRSTRRRRRRRPGDAAQERWWTRPGDGLVAQFDGAEAARRPAGAPALRRYLSLDGAPVFSLTSVDVVVEGVERAAALGFTDVVVHWPRAEGVYAGPERRSRSSPHGSRAAGAPRRGSLTQVTAGGSSPDRRRFDERRSDGRRPGRSAQCAWRASQALATMSVERVAHAASRGRGRRARPRRRCGPGRPGGAAASSGSNAMPVRLGHRGHDLAARRRRRPRRGCRRGSSRCRPRQRLRGGDVGRRPGRRRGCSRARRCRRASA